MSKRYDAMKQFRLLPDTLKALETVQAELPVKIGLNTLANECITLGIPKMRAAGKAMRRIVEPTTKKGK